MGVVHVVAHGNHAGGGHVPAETARTHLRVDGEEVLGSQGFRLKTTVLLEALKHTQVLVIHFNFVLFEVSNDVEVAGCRYRILRAVAEKLHFRHQVDVGGPEGLFSDLLLVHEKHSQNELFEIVFFCREQLRVTGKNGAQNWVRHALVEGNDDSLGHAEESFPVLDGLLDSDADEPPFEKVGVLQFGALDPLLLAPLVEASALAQDDFSFLLSARMVWHPLFACVLIDH